MQGFVGESSPDLKQTEFLTESAENRHGILWLCADFGEVVQLRPRDPGLRQSAKQQHVPSAIVSELICSPLHSWPLAKAQSTVD